MSNIVNNVAALILVGLLPTGVAIQASGPKTVNAATAEIMANNCFTCHGTDGRSPGAIPSLSGKTSEFIATNMKRFRSGERKSTVMERHAKAYSDAEIEALANYIGKLK